MRLLPLLFLLLTQLVFAAPPPANEVFQLQVKPQDPNHFLINFNIKPDYFLYQDRLKLTVPADSPYHLGSLNLPKPETHLDSKGRSYAVYTKHMSLQVPILGETAGEGLIILHYQGCAADGYCYPPETREIKLTIDPALALTDVELMPPSPEAMDAVEEVMEEAGTEMSQENWFLLILSFYGLGLLLAFTPCVLPMVPVLSGIIVGHGDSITTKKAFGLSLSYVLSMALTYAAVGVVVALLGSNLQIVMQSPWAIGLFSLVFVILALSMFGYFELRLPVSWQAKLASISRSQANGHYLGAALMGCLSTLILSPCVTAPLIGALSLIAQRGEVWLGLFSLFFLGLGMGTPLLLIGTSAGKLLPKAGGWMNDIKTLFGVVLLGMAIFLLGRILSGPITLVLWALLLIFTGVYCGALQYAANATAKFRQGLGLILLFYGFLQLLGASMGNQDPLQPLKFKSAQLHAATAETIRVTTLAELEQLIRMNRGKPIMLDYYADWCTSCKILAETVLQDPKVLDSLKSFVVIQVDITAHNPQSKALLKRFDVVAPPTFVFLNRQGEEVTAARLVGEVSVEAFLAQLDKV